MNTDKFEAIASTTYLDEGYTPCIPRPGASAQWDANVAALVHILENRDHFDTFKYGVQLREAMTTDTFPLTFADSLAREMRARYAVANPGMMRIARPGTVPDFRTKKSFRYDGLTGRLQVVPEKGEYLASELTEARKTYTVAKYGRQCDFSWESFINDDLGIFSEIAQRLVDATINTREYFITSLFADASGPTDAAFSIPTATGALTIANLEVGVAAMNEQTLTTDTGVVPLLARPQFLVVPERLRFTAKRILNSTLLIGQGADAVPIGATNVIASEGLELIVNPWLPLIDTTSGNTAWYLFSGPRDLAFMEIGRLRGHEEPEIHLKASNMQRVGGGLDTPLMCDFVTDNIFYRARFILGGVVTETVAGYASTGAG